MKTDKLIDLAKLGLIALIIFTLVKSFKELADWLGGAEKSVSGFFGGIGKTIGEAGETIQKAVGEAGETVTKTTKKITEKIVVPVVSTEPYSISGIGRPFTSVLSSTLKTKHELQSTSSSTSSKKVTPSIIAKYHIARAGLIYLMRKRAKPSEYIKFFKKVQQLP